MNKTLKTLLGFLAATVAILAALPMTGCNTLQKAQDEYPIAYDLLKGGAEIALTYYLGTTSDSFVVQNREALLAATRDVFAENEDPRDVALALSKEVEAIYPDDPATRDAIMRNLAVVLRSEPDPDTPASGPNAEAQREYNADLADALDSPDEVASAPASGFAGIGYDAEDAANDRRQDLIGYVLGLKEKPDQSYSEYGYAEHRSAVKRVEALKD